MSEELTIHRGSPAELDSRTAYQILRLRVAVFVVEQHCAYPELDGRDLEDGAEWLWASSGDQVVATLRILRDDPATARIGRVATDAGWRSRGLAARLLDDAVAGVAEDQAIVLDAQSELAGWYARFGFSADGVEFLEDGIAHLPMRRPARAG